VKVSHELIKSGSYLNVVYVVGQSINYKLEEGRFVTIGLHHVLAFFTGAEVIPPMGFHGNPSVEFVASILPMASTCSLTLKLPIDAHDDNEAFKSGMMYGLLHHGGFGEI
jgi:hypothetical protein